MPSSRTNSRGGVTFTINADRVTAALETQLSAVVEQTCQGIRDQAIATAREDMSANADDIVLKESITYKMITPLKGVVYVETKSENSRSAENYALMQEFGHPNPDVPYGFTPYMRPAARDHEDIFIAAIKGIRL